MNSVRAVRARSDARRCRGDSLVALALVALVALCAARPAHAGRGDLLRIVQQRCLPDWLQRHDPAPCLRVYLPDNNASSAPSGYALLADRKGGAHVLLIALRTLSGIESPQLLQPHVPNYFAAAWDARGLLKGRAPYDPQAGDIGLAINSRYSRGQDQLHIHIECQGAALHQALQAHAAELSAHWTTLAVDGHEYSARRVMGASLGDHDPFKLVANGVPQARDHMALYTLIVAAVQFREGPGFALLARQAILRGGEALLDSTCAAAAR